MDQRVTVPGTTPLAASGRGRSLRQAPEAARGWLSRRSLPAVSWTASFVVLAAVLLARNAYLFTTRIYEDSDFAANTIAALQAKHFTLLVGNYSKEGFYHPGPAFLYLMAAGESLFHDLLHLVPTPWNGQMLAILLLNAALLAASVAVIARQAGSRVAAAAGLTVVLLAIVIHPLSANSPWMPYVYIAPTLLLLVSAASVGSGRSEHLPLLAGSALLCVNGQAEFLLFAPVTAVISVVGLIVTRRRTAGVLRRVPAHHWAVALAVAVVLALPIIVNTAVHWPGVFGSYFHYMRAIHGAPTTHSPAFTIKYTLRFWWPGATVGASASRSLLVAGVTGILALVLALSCPRPDLRRFLLWSVGMIILTTAMFLGYAFKAVDDNAITQTYLGYFYWAAPVLTVLVAVIGAVAWADQRAALVGTAVATVAAVTVAVIAGVVPQHQDNPDDPPATYAGDPGIPRDVHALAAAAHQRPIVLQMLGGSWVTAVGIVAYADRTGVRSCVAEADWGIVFRSQSVCTPGEMRSGVRFTVGTAVQDGRPEPVPRGSRVVLTVPRTDTRITTP